jgi:ABC-type spermidine/putrescine transport system permease subunit I
MALTQSSRLRQRLSGFQTGLHSSGWVVPLFLLVWVGMVIVPLIILCIYSLFESRSFRTIYTPSLATWVSLFDSGRWEVAVRTLRIALTVTLVELAIGFPFAVWLAKGCRSRGVRAVVISLLTIPFFLDISSRTIVWRAILGQNGLINSMLISLGWIDRPVEWMLYTEFSVHFGMIAPYFPTMVLPIYLAVSFIDDELIEASSDLGASPLNNLTNIIIPLSLPGVMAGIIFTLGPALAAWVEPGMLGGGFVNLLSNSVESAYTALKYPILAALSTFVILLLAIMLIVMLLLTRRFTDFGNVFKAMRR